MTIRSSIAILALLFVAGAEPTAYAAKKKEPASLRRPRCAPSTT
jgi:hypothetical protein